MNWHPYIFVAAELGVLFVHLLGIAHAVHAIFRVRTPQGAIAWSLCLIMFPWLSIPAYWIFGARKFRGYVEARRSGNLKINHIAQELWHRLADFRAEASPEGEQHQRLMEALAKMPATRANKVDLLIDGAATFDAMFEEIERAEKYILIQFFIVHDDELGRALQERLIRKARAGVRVHFLYDEVGSRSLTSRYNRELANAGVAVTPFNTGKTNRFQLNFRNHRKITLVDGRVAFIGGLNAGDEYMGRSKRFGPWRDTHVRIEGPAVQCVQLSFLEDWYWATRQVPELNWVPTASARGDQRVLVLPTSPADEFETCDLFFTHCIHSARRRIWITSPYFVPDDSIVDALQLAAMRGVDVRIMLPEKPDHILVYHSAFSYYAEMNKAKVRLFRYQPGFMHQKVMLADDSIGVVGTANLDTRSFRLNFELTALVADADFAREVEQMLEADFSRCKEAVIGELEQRSFFFRLFVAVSRLLSPVQ